ncbi:MAG: endonuclease/exonuclease/phosphatase family protein [Anaerolineaceae bacterium]|nr:MAG: endonuclease/exonuclease/phosphatase family protein [Anaerolineaceae bacterium]
MLRIRIPRTFVAASVLLFFIQGLRVIFSVMFGIIYDQVFEGPMNSWLIVSNLLVVVVLIAPSLAPKKITNKWLAAFVLLTAIARVALSVNDASVRYWGALLTLAFGGLYQVGLLKEDRSLFVSGLVSALALDQILRVVGYTYDLSLRPEWLPAVIIWAVLVSFVALWISRNHVKGESDGGMTWLDGLVLGGFFFLETSLLAMPNGIAHWTHIPYSLVAPLLLTITLSALFPEVQTWVVELCKRAIVRIGLVVILILGLIIGYFTEGILSGLLLIAVQATTLVSFLCVLNVESGKADRAGLQFSLGMIFMLLLNFFNAFAFTYPYVLPVMRGLGWVIYLVAVLIIGFRMLRVVIGEKPEPTIGDSALIGLVSLGAIALSILMVWPQSAAPLSSNGSLRAATYNIHYGYDDDWHFKLEEMAQAIEAADVDVIALQEVDTGRMTSYSVDDALYLGRRLRMNVAYLPAVEHLTGIAVLYRGPEVAMDQRLLTSLQEQTGIIGVRLEVQEKSIYSYGIWMGLSNEDTQRQITEALQFIGENSPATFGGDFNARPNSPVTMAIEEADFIDPFVALDIKPAPATSPAINPKGRIDFVWLRDLTPLRAWVSDSLASDHRMVVVEVAFP